MEVTWGAVHAEGEIAHVFAGLAEVCHDILHFHVSVPLLYVGRLHAVKLDLSA